MHQSPPSFAQLLRSAPLLKALESKGYTHPTPIQAQAIPPVLAGGDLLGLAQTGTGKTAAFALPILQRFSEASEGTPSETTRRGHSLRCLVLTPTRELCVQVAESFQAYGLGLHLKVAQIFGGVGEEPQRQTLRRGVDIIVATPGRLLDFLNQGAVRLDRIEVLVLDEADRMLDMGFLPDVKRIVSHVSKQRQTLLFSATMPREIATIAAQWLHNPTRIEVAPVSSTPERIDQSVYFIEKGGKAVLLREVVEKEDAQKVLVFSRTKHGADRVCRILEKERIASHAIHGNKSQNARQRALNEFRDGSVRVLVATDLAARGIDVKGIDLVVNYDLPNEPETYVHRIGRTARAGANGRAVSFCSRDERPFLQAIERLTRIPIEVRAVPEGMEQLSSGPGDTDERPDRPRQAHGPRGQRSGQSRSPGQRPQVRHDAPPRGEYRPSQAGPSRGPSNRPRTESRDGRSDTQRAPREYGNDSRRAPEGEQGRRQGNRPNNGNSRDGQSESRGGNRYATEPGRDGRSRPAAAAKPEVHHENKTPLWARLVNKFSGKPDDNRRGR